MKRDMDLVRKLLLFVEEHGNDRHDWINDVPIEGYTEEQITHHIWLLGDGGYMEFIDNSCDDGTCFLPRCLTWRGAEFLDAVRRQDIWQQTLDLAKRGGTESISAVFEIAKALVQKKLEKMLQLSE